MLVRNFKKIDIKGTRILFDGRGSNEFLLLRGTNFKTTCHILSYFFGTVITLIDLI